MRLKFGKKTSRSRVARLKNKARIRRKIEGTSERPRLAVYRSNSNMYAQLIDDVDRKVLVSSSSIKLDVKNKSNIEAAKAVGEALAKQAQSKNISSVVFDRSGYVYHGRVKAVADSARENGLKF